MKFRQASFVFFCAAALLPPATATAVESETQTVYNLGGNATQTVDAGNILTIQQEINDTFSGTLDGSGTVLKQGSAELKLAGTVNLGTFSVEEGTLTFADGIIFGNTLTELNITNEATLVLGFNGGNIALNIADNSRLGNVVSTGTLTANRISGDILNVNAGTLTVNSEAIFNRINILSGAKLQIGTGKADSLPALSGDIELETGATLIFNRAANTSSDYINYSGQISGGGDLVFNGNAPVYFNKGLNQTYTGTTVLNAGGMIFRRATITGSDGGEYYNPDAKAAEFASPEISVNAGALFGGHVSVAGNVSVSGTAFSSVADWESKIGKNTFGSWHFGAGTLYATGNDTLTLNGDLKIAKTEFGIYQASETTYDYAGNSGGALRVDVNKFGAGKIIANGNVELGGSLILVGSDDLVPGKRYIFFESDATKTTGTFDQVVYGSENVTLLLPGVGGVSDNQYGVAAVENRNVRKRAAFDEHDGLADFVDYLVGQSDSMNKVAQAVSLADAGNVTSTVNNFSALPYCSLAEMAIRQSDLELDMILQNISRIRLSPPPSQDGVRVPANFTFFSGVLTDFVDHESKNNTPVYDFDSVGAYLGGHKWIDDERIAGFSLGLHHSSAKPHGSGGTLDDIAARAKIFAVFTPKFSDWFLTVGGTFGAHHYDINRKTALGENFGNTDGIDAGLFIAYNYRAEIDKDLFFTPYLRFEYNFSYVGSFKESGSASRLDLRHILYNSYRLRVGSGFEYLASEGKIFAVDFGFIGSFGEDPEITSAFAEYAGSQNKIKGTVDEPMSFEIAPRVGLKLGDNWSADAVYRVQSTFSGSLSHSFGIGFSREF